VAAGTTPKFDISGKCPGGVWDTQGGEDPNKFDRDCSGVNWLYYLFRGTLSTTTDWSRARSPGQVVPSNLSPGRSACQPGTRPAFAPSCDPGNGRLGDWVETIIGGGGSDIPRYLGQLIAAQGVVTTLSSQPVPGGGQLHGKAVTLEVYLWDCAENYQGNNKWSLITSNGDCSTTFGPSDPTPDRVHLFTVVSYVVYEGLVSSNSVQGYFAGVLADPTTCQSCAVNPFANSVALIGDP
jgi:hypothetical protein